jgi:hypothetical protein
MNGKLDAGSALQEQTRIVCTGRLEYLSGDSALLRGLVMICVNLRRFRPTSDTFPKGTGRCVPWLEEDDFVLDHASDLGRSSEDQYIHFAT